MIFLVQYDRNVARLVRFERFPNEQRAEAERARLDLELSQIGHDAEQEIVLFEAEDEQSLRRTHARYFETLAGLLAPSGLEAET